MFNTHGSVTEQITEVTLRMCCIPTETRDKNQFCDTAAVKRYKKLNTNNNQGILQLPHDILGGKDGRAPCQQQQEAQYPLS